ncbi:MAG: SIR2 family NAD-dependent protein deacylase [Bacteriovoracaceae bacterium]
MKAILDYKKIVILTGAGISAESGLATFRDSQGLWEKHKVEDIATPEAFQKDPLLVWKFYSMRRLQAAKAKPNSAHLALVEFAKIHPDVHLITQNVDALHLRADPTHHLPPICMHGSLHESSCSHCGVVYLDDHAYFNEAGDYAPQETDLCDSIQKSHQHYLHQYKIEYRNFLPLSPCCKVMIRPHIVWFGEMPLQMERIYHQISRCDLFISIGTSGVVYPAASFLAGAKAAGSHTVCLNKEPIPQTAFIDEFIEGKATEIVPKFFKL